MRPWSAVSVMSPALSTRDVPSNSRLALLVTRVCASGVPLMGKAVLFHNRTSLSAWMLARVPALLWPAPSQTAPWSANSSAPLLTTVRL